MHIDNFEPIRSCSLTPSGFERGSTSLRHLAAPGRRYVVEVARWVLAVPFGELLSAIHRLYPEMALRSVAPEVVQRYPRRGALIVRSDVHVIGAGSQPDLIWVEGGCTSRWVGYSLKRSRLERSRPYMRV